MGDSISDGQLGSWVKQVGEFVNTDEVVVSIETDKAAQYGFSSRRFRCLTLCVGIFACPRLVRFFPFGLIVPNDAHFSFFFFPSPGTILEHCAPAQSTVMVGRELFKYKPGGAPAAKPAAAPKVCDRSGATPFLCVSRIIDDDSCV